jgi:transcriptional regulator with GAF, ATPase, and Fis domain
MESAISDGDRLLLGDATSPVILVCKIDLEEEQRNTQERILATRRLNELQSVLGQVEQGPDASALYRAVKMLGGRLDIDAVLDAIANAVFELTPMATHLSILLQDGKDEVRFVPMLARSREGSEGSDPVLMSRAVLRRVLKDRAAILAANAVDELGSSESIMGADIRSTLGVPLRRADQIIGVIEADNRAGSGMFTHGISTYYSFWPSRPPSRSTMPSYSSNCSWPRSASKARTFTSVASRSG